jgi:UDP-galactopyranose mutase
MPLHGYSVMVRKMLAHPNIRIMLNARWQDIKEQVSFERMVFTGPIDEFFEYKHGELPYRSLRFDVQTRAVDHFQQAAVINYPNEYDYTRVTEQKWLTGQIHAQTTTLTEYPLAHEVGKTVPYYPIPTEANRQQYALYETEASKLKEKVIFAGRLADYMYYNMDQAVARALMLFGRI